LAKNDYCTNKQKNLEDILAIKQAQYQNGTETKAEVDFVSTEIKNLKGDCQ
jgi:hypothetical protein